MIFLLSEVVNFLLSYIVALNTVNFDYYNVQADNCKDFRAVFWRTLAQKNLESTGESRFHGDVFRFLQLQITASSPCEQDKNSKIASNESGEGNPESGEENPEEDNDGLRGIGFEHEANRNRRCTGLLWLTNKIDGQGITLKTSAFIRENALRNNNYYLPTANGFSAMSQRCSND